MVLLHGWPDTGDLWRHQVPALGRGRIPGDRAGPARLRRVQQAGRAVAAYTAPPMVGDVVGVLDALGIDRAHLVGHDWGAAIAWLTAALAPDRVASLTALSVGHPAAFRAAGWRQREKSWYMLLFQFPGVAEQWLCADDFRNLREWSAHPDIDAVVERLADPAALTASLGLYRAILPPESLVEPPTAAAAGDRAGDGRVEQRRLRADRGGDDRLGRARDRRRGATSGSTAPATGCNSTPPSGQRAAARLPRPDTRAGGRDRGGGRSAARLGRGRPDHQAEAHLVAGALAPDHVPRLAASAAAGSRCRSVASCVQVTRRVSPGVDRRPAPRSGAIAWSSKL